MKSSNPLIAILAFYILLGTGSYLALFNPKEANQTVNLDLGDYGIWEVVVPPSKQTTSHAYHTKGDLEPTYVVQLDFNGYDHFTFLGPRFFWNLKQ